jgi:formylmethanofuran dehydrogenase subunit E
VGDIPQEEKNWVTYAMANNIKCKICGEKIPYGEQHVYYERGLCGLCAYKLDKKD